MVWLGVDLGNARVGLALSDPELTLAHPAGNITVRRDYFEALDDVLNVIEDNRVDRVVIGLPLDMDGTEGRSAKKARRWSTNLVTRLEHERNDPQSPPQGGRRSAVRGDHPPDGARPTMSIDEVMRSKRVRRHP